MYKNKTLRGLAISAVVALGFSGLATTPAAANYGLADKTFVTIAPAEGDEWTVLANSKFRIEANKAALTGELSLLVEDASSAVTNSGLARAADKSFVLGNAEAASSTSASSVWELDQAVNGRTADSASKTVKVTAFNDANNNGKIDSTEYASTTETITFLDSDDVTLNVSLNRPYVGEPTLSAIVSTTPTLNDEQMISVVSLSDVAEVVFQKGGIATTASAPAANWVWDEDDRNYTVTSPDFTAWGFSSLSAIAVVTASAAALDTVVIETANAHNALVGDGFTFSTSNETGRATVSKIVSTTKFEATTLTTSPGATFSAAAASLSAVTNVLAKATAGTYVAFGYWNDVKVVTSEFATSAVVADSVEIDIAGSASVDAVVGSESATARIKAGTLAVDVVATVYDEDGDAVGAGKVVQISNNYASGADFKVNGKTGTDTVLTDAKGQVKATVTSVAGAKDLIVNLTFKAEGAVQGTAALTWVAQSFSLIDLSVANGSFASQTRSILKGGSYALDLAVVDQWYAAPADASVYRVTVTGAGAANGILTLTNGKTSVTIGDNGLATEYETVITLQKLGTTGTWATVGSAVTVTTKVATGVVTLGADATSLYGATVDLASDVAAKALVEGDIRVAPLTVPAYANNAVVAGSINNATTGVGVNGAVVTISGPTSLLFSNGVVYKRGSITVVADSSGHFNVKVYSTTAATDVVVTAAALGNTSTTKVTFSGVGIGEGKSLVITAPTSVAPASTLQIKAKLADSYGNGVQASAGRIKMTYTGAGIGFGTLPDATDKNGELSYSVLLGAGDEGTITVVVSYDQNGDGDFVDADDLSTTKTVTVASASEPEVNAVIGTFQGRWAVRVENAKGSTVTVKVGGNWYKYPALNDNYLFSRKSKVGASVLVKVWVDGELQNEQTITIK